MKFLPNRVRIRCQDGGKMCILSLEGGLRERVGDGILFWSAQSPTTVQSGSQMPHCRLQLHALHLSKHPSSWKNKRLFFLT